MVFQMSSVSSAASVTAVSARQVLLGASFDLHLLFLAFLWSSWPSWDQYETKGLFCAVTFPSFVSSAQVTSTFHFYVSALNTGKSLSEVILSSGQPLCKVSYADQNSCASFCHLQLH